MIETYSLYLSVRCGMITLKPLTILLNRTTYLTQPFRTSSRWCASPSRVTTLYFGLSTVIASKVCIEYDFNHYDGEANLNCFKVQYEDDPTRFSLRSTLNLQGSDLSTSLFKIKHSNWRYEKEYRWVLHDEELIGNKLYVNKECLSAVILSEHAPPDRKLKVLMICQSLGIPVKHAIARQNSCTFEVVN